MSLTFVCCISNYCMPFPIPSTATNERDGTFDCKGMEGGKMSIGTFSSCLIFLPVDVARAKCSLILYASRSNPHQTYPTRGHSQ